MTVMMEVAAALWTSGRLRLRGLGVPAPCSGSVAEEKGGGPGADSVSADSAEGGQGRGEGGVPGLETARQDPHSLGILARAGGELK